MGKMDGLLAIKKIQMHNQNLYTGNSLPQSGRTQCGRTSILDNIQGGFVFRNTRNHY